MSRHRIFGRAARFVAGLSLAVLAAWAPSVHADTWYGNIPGTGSASCYAGTFTVPNGANYVEMTVIGQHGSDGMAYKLTDYAEGVGGLGGIVKVVAAVTPGQKLWAAPTSSLFKIWGVSNGGGSGGYGSFVATADPSAACPYGTPDKNSLVVVAGGGGGGASGSPRGTGGSGGNAGPNGVGGGNGGNNNQQDGGGGGGGTQSAGGFGGAAGHGNLFSADGNPGGAGGYFAGGTEGSATPGADDPVSPGGGGGGGYYGGGGGGGDAGGGGGGGGGGSNYIAASIPTGTPAWNQPSGTWANGSTAAYALVQIIPIFTTTTTIASSPNPSAFNQPIAISATVTSSSGAAPYGGDVNFYDGTSLLGTVALSGGVATLNISTLGQGTHYLQAIYQGFGSDAQIQQASATQGSNVGGVILPYQHVVGAPPPTPVAPAVTTQPYSQSRTYGDATVYFFAEASGTPTPAIQWQVSSDNGAHFTNTSGSGGFGANYLAIAPAVELNGYQYRAVFANSAGSATTNVATLSVNKAPLYITANNKAVAYLGPIPALDATYGDANFGAVLKNGDTPGSLNGTLACTTTATMSSLPGAYPIACSGVSSPNYAITFKPGTLTVNAPTQAIIVTDSSIPHTPPPGSPGNLTFKDVDVGTGYDITAFGGNSGQPITFAVSASLGPAPDFNCTDAYGACTDVVEGTSTPVCTVTTTGIGKAHVSFNAVLKQSRFGRCYINLNQAGATVNGAVYPAAPMVQLDFKINYRAPGIAPQPTDQSVGAAQAATFSVGVTGAPVPNVQWQVSNDNGASFNDIAGETANTLILSNPQPAQNGNKYRVRVSNNPGQTLVYMNTDIVSSAATLSVSSLPGPPYVSLNPAVVTTLDSNPVTLTAIGGGNPAPTSVTWQMSSDDGASYSDVVADPFTIISVGNNAGVVTTTLKLSIPGYNYNRRLYRAVFTNANGSATSQAARLIVQDPLLLINNGKPVDTSVAVGQSASLAVDYIAEPAPMIQWQVKSAGTWVDIPGAMAQTLNLAHVDPSMHGSQYQVVLTQGSPFNRTATSRTATLSVVSASPSVNATPVGSVVFGAAINDSATLAGGYNPGGTLTFALYGAGDATCAAAPVFTRVVAVAGNGTYQSPWMTPASVGTYQWTLAYSGDANNNAASVPCGTTGQSVVVTKADQSIVFGAVPKISIGRNGAVTATGGASGKAVVFGTSSDSSICMVATTGTVTGIGVGDCIVTANQDGNANYNDAPQATQTVPIDNDYIFADGFDF